MSSELDWARCAGEEINLDSTVMYSFGITLGNHNLTVPCAGAESTEVSTTSVQRTRLQEQNNWKKSVVLT